MTPLDPTSELRRRLSLGLLTIATALTTLTIAAATSAASGSPRVKLDSTMFAAQVGTTTGGGSVYAGALPDPKLGHGAIVFTTTTGNAHQHVTFQEFFALGSIKGNGSVTPTPQGGGRYKLAGSLNITGGTGRYRSASGRLTVAGNINKAGMIMATLKGYFTH